MWFATCKHTQLCRNAAQGFHCTAVSLQTPVTATQEEVEQEAEAIRSVTSSKCPIKGVLDRVIVTTSGAHGAVNNLHFINHGHCSNINQH